MNLLAVLITKPKDDSLEKTSHPRTLVVRAASLKSVTQGRPHPSLKTESEGRASSFPNKSLGSMATDSA